MTGIKYLIVLLMIISPVSAAAASECRTIIDNADSDSMNMDRLHPARIDSKLKDKDLTLFLINYRIGIMDKHLQELQKVFAHNCKNTGDYPALNAMAVISQTRLTTLKQDYIRWKERVEQDIPEPTPTPEPENPDPGDFRNIVKSFASYPSGQAKEHLKLYIDEVQAARERNAFDPDRSIDEKMIFKIVGLLYAISKDNTVFEEAKREGIIATLFFPINKVTYDTLRQFVEFLTGTGNGKLDELVAIVSRYDDVQKKSLLNLFLNILSSFGKATDYGILLDQYLHLEEKEKEHIIEFFFRLILDYSHTGEFTAVMDKLAGMDPEKISRLIEMIPRAVENSTIPDEKKRKLFLSYWDALSRYEVKDMEQLGALLDRLTEYNQLTGNAPLKLFLGILENYKPDDIPLWKELITTVSRMSGQERTVWTNFLPSFQMSHIRDLVTDVNLTADKKQVSVFFDPFLFTGTTYANLQDNTLINTQFRKMLDKRYSLVYSTYDRPVFKIRGYFALENGQYVPAVEFWSEKNRLLIFAETCRIKIVNGKIREKELTDCYTQILDRFDQFLASLYRVAKSNPGLIARVPEPEEMAAIIRSKIIIESSAQNISAASLLAEDRITGVYLGEDLFWEKTGARDTEAEQLLGSDIRGRLVAYLNKNYLIDEPNNFILEKPAEGKHYLKINLEFYRKPAEARFTGHNEVDILFKKTNTLLLVNKVYFEKQLLADNRQLVADAVIERIAIELAAFFNLQRKVAPKTTSGEPGLPQNKGKTTTSDNSSINKTGEPDAPIKTVPRLQILSNFLMPGYTIQNNLKTDDPLFLKIAVAGWNYSNFALLGTAFASQMIFMGSGYDRNLQPLFYVSLGAAVLYIMNGTIGAITSF